MKNLIKQILSLVPILIGYYQNVYSQSDVASALGAGHTFSLGYYVGWTSADDINFLNPSQNMTIKGATGRVGIGLANPNWRLDVIDDINITPTALNYINNGYRIGGRLVMYLPGDNLGWKNTFAGRSGNTGAAPGQKNTYLGYEAGFNTSSAAQENVLVGVDAGRRINSTTGATYIGFEAGYSNSQPIGGSDFNTFVGWKSGWSDKSSGGNAFFGKESGYTNQLGNWNTFLGYHSGYLTTTGQNTFVGSSSGGQNTIGTLNTFVGWNSGLGNTINGRNTFIGSDVASVNPSGEDNTFVGALSGHFNKGNYNTYIGNQSGYSLTTGAYNTMIGYISGYYNQASANSFLGGWSGEFHNTGDYNTYIGYQAQFVPTTTADPLNNLVNSAAIGAHAIVTRDNEMILGDNYVNVGIGLSGEITGVNNKLELNAIISPTPNIDDMVPNVCGGTGLSGLRFRDLTDLSIPCTNQGKGVLALNSSGDVIYVNELTGGLGNLCSAPQMPLSGNYEIPLNGNTFYFSPFAGAISPCADNVGIGMSCGNNYIYAKLHVVQPVTCAPHGISISEAGRFDNSAGGWLARSILGQVTVPATINEGVYGYVPVAGTPGTTSYAIVGDLGLGNPPCPLLPCTPSGDFAGYFNGDVLSTTGNFLASDANLKHNISEIENPLKTINQLLPKTYEYNQQENLSMRLPSGTHYGLLAQDVAAVLPELTKDCLHPARYDSEGKEIYAAINYKALNYTELIPLLIAGMKQQQNQIEELKNIIHDCCQNQVPGLNENNSIDNPAGTIELKSEMAYLYQNQPNPFDKSTVIRYFIPQNSGSAKIIFMDDTGRIINEVVLVEKGMGSINVISSELNSGIYTYSLELNGKILETKKMIKAH